LDNGENTKVTYPDGLAVYPNNTLWALLMIIAMVAGFTGIMIPTMRYDKNVREKMAKNKNS